MKGVRIATLVTAVGMVLGGIITGIVESVSGSSTSGGSSTNTDNTNKIWNVTKKVFKWIVDKLFAMVGAIASFIFNLLKKVVGEASVGIFILIGIIASGLITNIWIKSNGKKM